MARLKKRQLNLSPSERARGLPWKVLLSVLLTVHLLAVLAEPFRFFTRSGRGTSPAADPIRLVLSPYVEFAYLNHGYFFFAPEPGPSHLMECRLRFEDGEQRQLMFPDKFAQRPRLLYHRHFMLAEFLHGLHVPPFQPELAGGDPLLARSWKADRQLFEMVRDSMTDHLVSKYDAISGELQRIEHRLPSSVEVFEQRLPLDSPTLYVALPDAPIESSELPPVAPRVETGFLPQSISIAPKVESTDSFEALPKVEEVRP